VAGLNDKSRTDGLTASFPKAMPVIMITHEERDVWMRAVGRGKLRMLRRLQREQEPKSRFVFTSERGSPVTTAGFARMVERAGD
jgi:hypothetical protein